MFKRDLERGDGCKKLNPFHTTKSVDNIYTWKKYTIYNRNVIEKSGNKLLKKSLKVY